MTILNDLSIIGRSTKPTHRFVTKSGIAHYGSDLFGQITDKWVTTTGLVLPKNGVYDTEPITGDIDFAPMIEPFEPWQVRESEDRRKLISYGTSSYGYDLRLGHKFKVFTNVNSRMIDPKNFDEMTFVDVEIKDVGGEIIIPPNSFILGYSLEYIRIPRDVLGIVVGKSTIARCGIDCLVTPLEPEWEGNITLEFSNTSPLPAKLYVGEGCCQVVFHQGNGCMVSYKDRAGKYMKQAAEAVTPKV